MVEVILVVFFLWVYCMCGIVCADIDIDNARERLATLQPYQATNPLWMSILFWPYFMGRRFFRLFIN